MSSNPAPAPPDDERGEGYSVAQVQFSDRWAIYERHNSRTIATYDTKEFAESSCRMLNRALADERRKAREECCAAMCNGCKRGMPVEFIAQYSEQNFWIHRGDGVSYDCGAARIRSLPASGTERERGQECGHEWTFNGDAPLKCNLCGIEKGESR